MSNSLCMHSVGEFAIRTVQAFCTLSKSNKDNDMQLAQSNLKNLHVTAHHHLAATAFACYGGNTSLRLSPSCSDSCGVGTAKDQAMQTLPRYDHWTTLLVCNQTSYQTVNSAGLHACYTVLNE